MVSRHQGFKLGHVVIDRKTLNHTALKLVSGFTTIYTVLIAMTETVKLPVNEAEGGACDLELDQIETVKLVLGLNTTMRCANSTLGTMLAIEGT